MTRGTLVGVVTAVGLASGVRAAPHGCQTGVASAPFIGQSDMRAIKRSVRSLPASDGPRAALNIGSAAPGGWALAALPNAVTRVLPQYRHYRGFRENGILAIVDPRSRRLVYLLPLEGTAAPTNCP